MQRLEREVSGALRSDVAKSCVLVCYTMTVFEVVSAWVGSTNGSGVERVSRVAEIGCWSSNGRRLILGGARCWL